MACMRAMPTSWRGSRCHRRSALAGEGRVAGADRARLVASRAQRPSAKAEGKPREDFIVTLDRSDDQTAFIKVRCQLPPRYFTDYLVAMKLSDGWKIVSKSYRYDLRE